jgi:hypothetical protein
VIAIDTNILVHAHRLESRWNERAFAKLRSLMERRALWAIPWPCIHEFVSIVTKSGMWKRPSTTAEAIAQVEVWMGSPSLALLGEADGYWSEFRPLAERAKATGGLVHDARIAAICLSHGVDELWTADRDFGRFPGLSTRNPLVEEA